ncbi:hypothetical protein AVEN_215264-1, partial [Araneus ventricosus]
IVSFLTPLSRKYSQRMQAYDHQACPATRTSLDTSIPSTPTASPAHLSSCATTVLALDMHAGSFRILVLNLPQTRRLM